MRGDNTAGRDQSFFADFDVFEKRDVHADDCAAPDQRTFHDCAVADRAVFFDNGGGFAGMEHAVVLDTCAGADDDRIGVLIGPDDGAPPDARLFPDSYVANDDCGRSDECICCYRGCLPFVLDNHAHFTSAAILPNDMRRYPGNQDKYLT